jgi:phosphoribosylformylglycinamidine cyclo-ligase
LGAEGPKRTYRDAGVDIDTAESLVKVVREQARATFTPGVLSDVGFFGGLFELKGYREPVLVSSTDGVGTKLKIACALGKHDTVGIDIVNHCTNDILACGASPLFFQDYIAMAKLIPEVIASVTGGMAHALAAVGCALIGGETAEMPGLYPEGEYDLVGFIVGAVEKDGILTGASIAAGDRIIGLPSSGLHTNGYSLVRKVFNTDEDPSVLNRFRDQLGITLGEKLLEPHRCYFPTLKPWLNRIKGLAHITGGGIPGNLPRTIPQGLAARVDKGAWEVPAIFSLIQQQGNIDEQEMYRVFNMGIGMMVICSPDTADKFIDGVPESKVIGEVIEQEGENRVSLA